MQDGRYSQADRDAIDDILEGKIVRQEVIKEVSGKALKRMEDISARLSGVGDHKGLPDDYRSSISEVYCIWLGIINYHATGELVSPEAAGSGIVVDLDVLLDGVEGYPSEMYPEHDHEDLRARLNRLHIVNKIYRSGFYTIGSQIHNLKAAAHKHNVKGAALGLSKAIEVGTRMLFKGYRPPPGNIRLGDLIDEASSVVRLIYKSEGIRFIGPEDYDRSLLVQGCYNDLLFSLLTILIDETHVYSREKARNDLKQSNTRLMASLDHTNFYKVHVDVVRYGGSVAIVIRDNGPRIDDPQSIILGTDPERALDKASAAEVLKQNSAELKISNVSDSADGVEMTVKLTPVPKYDPEPSLEPEDMSL